MNKVAIYVRSSKDLHNVSCEAQENEIRKVVKGNGELVYHVFTDKALSSTRDVRPEFDEMIGLATSKEPPFTKIYCLDTSRFGRNQYQTQYLLWTLRNKHGIEVDFIKMPKDDGPAGEFLESVMTAVDQLHSRQSKIKGIASMKQNIRNGYRAGGRAPFGYRLKTKEQGKHRDGRLIAKSILEPDPETAPIIKEFFERRAKGEARKPILDDFYSRGIVSPSGNDKWSPSSAKSIEDNVYAYLGHTVFNRHNERIKEGGKSIGYLHGQKWRPEEEWVIKNNTHEPLITQEIADRIMHIKKQGLRDAPSTAKSVYALTGLLKCSECGTNYTGDRGIYKCNSNSKPGSKCGNNDISQRKIEDVVFSLIQYALKIRNVKDFVARIRKKLQSGKSDVMSMEKQLDKIDKQIARMMHLYSIEAINDDDIVAGLTPLQERKKTIQEIIKNAKATEGVLEVSDADIMEVVKNLKENINNADPKIRKSAVRALFQEFRLFPKEGNPWERMLEVKGIYLPLTRYIVASPTGFEPVLQA
jgi:site-specific DNA recombinase